MTRRRRCSSVWSPASSSGRSASLTPATPAPPPPFAPRMTCAPPAPHPLALPGSCSPPPPASLHASKVRNSSARCTPAIANPPSRPPSQPQITLFSVTFEVTAVTLLDSRPHPRPDKFTLTQSCMHDIKPPLRPCHPSARGSPRTHTPCTTPPPFRVLHPASFIATGTHASESRTRVLDPALLIATGVARGAERAPAPAPADRYSPPQVV